MVFGLGILWPRLSEAGALSGLLVGFLMGMFKFIFGNVYPPPDCGQPDNRPGFVKMHFMYYGMYLIPYAFGTGDSIASEKSTKTRAF